MNEQLEKMRDVVSKRQIEIKSLESEMKRKVQLDAKEEKKENDTNSDHSE